MAAPHLTNDAAQKFRYFGGWCDKIHGRTVPMWGGPAHDYVSYEPFGVIGAIVPWNGPLFASTMVMAPALAAGNCVVLKSPDLAPYSVMKLVELIHEAGFPAGVVNLVTGAADVGEAMVSHPGIDKIQFIGSGNTAKKVLANAAQSLKPCGLELGGKSAVIVFDDADLQRAAQYGLSGAVAANGQGGVNGTRLLVQRGVYEPYLQMLSAMAGYINPGDPMDQATTLGPVITETALNRITGMVRRGVEQGGRIVAGGERMGGDHANGYFLPVTVLADVGNDTEIAQNEVFGPVLVVTPFYTEEEALALANSTGYGLGAYVHTQNLRRAHAVARELQAGQIHVNGSGEAMQPNVPFGGWKQSGHGRLGGVEGLHDFLQSKNIWMNLASRLAEKQGREPDGLLDPKGRSERSHARQGEVIYQALPQPRAMREESWRDFAFSEVWTQPVMSRRARYLVALASEVLTGADDAIRGDYVRSALKSGEHSVAELREAALRLGPCAGWAGATRLDKAVTPAVRALGSRSAKPARVAPNPGTQERAMHSTHSLSPVDAYP